MNLTSTLTKSSTKSSLSKLPPDEYLQSSSMQVQCLKSITDPLERYRYAQTLDEYLYTSHELGRAKTYGLYEYLDTDRHDFQSKN